MSGHVTKQLKFCIFLKFCSFFMNTFQHEKKSLGKSEIPGRFSFLTFFEHFYPGFSTLFKQRKKYSNKQTKPPK